MVVIERGNSDDALGFVMQGVRLGGGGIEIPIVIHPNVRVNPTGRDQDDGT